MRVSYYEILNIVEDKSLGFYNSEELINKIIEIAEENGDCVNIECVYDCLEYVNNNCDNLEISMIHNKDEIERILINMWSSIGIDIPSNYEDIVQYCYEDVMECADLDNWHSGDVSIAFRRWIESNAN